MASLPEFPYRVVILAPLLIGGFGLKHIISPFVARQLTAGTVELSGHLARVPELHGLPQAQTYLESFAEVPVAAAPPKTGDSPRTPTRLTPPYEFINVSTLRSGDRTIMLAGIRGPDEALQCISQDRTPWLCAELAREALRIRVQRNVLTCIIRGLQSNMIVRAECTVDGYDLARDLVESGWAQPTEGTNRTYEEAMRYSEQQKLGLWGWSTLGRDQIGADPASAEPSPPVSASKHKASAADPSSEPRLKFNARALPFSATDGKRATGQD